MKKRSKKYLVVLSMVLIVCFSLPTLVFAEDSGSQTIVYPLGTMCDDCGASMIMHETETGAFVEKSETERCYCPEYKGDGIFDHHYLYNLHTYYYKCTRCTNNYTRTYKEYLGMSHYSLTD